MAEHAPERIWTGIDIPKTIAGVLAAVSAAVVGSFLGVAGTLVGAAVASIVGSVGTEIYHRWINRSSKRLKATFVTAPAAVGTPVVVAAEDESPSDEQPDGSKQIRWGRVGLVAASLFLLAMGTLTAFELVTGKSAADAVGSSSGSSTTIGSVLTGNEKKTDTPVPASSSPATDGPAGTTQAPTTAPTEAPATTEPAAPTETTAPQPTGNATTGAPAEQNQQPGAETKPDSGTE